MSARAVLPCSQSVLILLTDGGNDAGVVPPLEAARFAAQTRLRIFTIGVGAAARQTLFGLSSGNTDLNVELLQQIVSITGGEYFRATNPQALQAVYRRINQLEPTVGRNQWLRPAAEWFNWPLALALLLSVPAALADGRALLTWDLPQPLGRRWVGGALTPKGDGSATGHIVLEGPSYGHKGKPAERRGRKATGLRAQAYDSGVATPRIDV